MMHCLKSGFGFSVMSGIGVGGWRSVDCFFFGLFIIQELLCFIQLCNYKLYPYSCIMTNCTCIDDQLEPKKGGK